MILKQVLDALDSCGLEYSCSEEDCLQELLEATYNCGKKRAFQ